MKYETVPFAEDDAEFIEQKIDTTTDSILPPEEGASRLIPNCRGESR